MAESRQSLKQKEKEESLEQLRKWIKDGDTVYTILRKVSRTGMKRVVSVVVILPEKNGRRVVLHPNSHVANVTGTRIERGWHDGLVMNGCGYDAGFQIVYDLQRALGYKELRHEWL